MVLKQDASASSAYSHTLLDAWHIRADSALCHDVQAGLEREWLVTNGLGGYAAGSLVGATTRSYHGLLVAALRPPVERTVLVAKIDEEVLMPGGTQLSLGVNEYQGGMIEPQGYRYLDAVALDGDIPCFFYKLSDTLTLEKRIWMEYGQNTTYIQYTLHRSSTTWQDNKSLPYANSDQQVSDAAVTLTLSPLCLSCDYHSTLQGSEDWRFLVEGSENRCRVRAQEGAPAYHLIADPSTAFTASGLWYWHIWHRSDHERGLPDQEDYYQPGLFHMTLTPGMRKTVVLMAETETSCSWGYGGAHHEELVAHALMRHQRRVRQILAVADRSIDNLQMSDPVLARLIMAADQFIVARPDYSDPSATTQPLRLSPNRKTIIAGYPWFADWGRDTMISLPGLMLYTGRYSEARGLLKAYISYVRHGLIPNRFPDAHEEPIEPIYNTIDATLWLFRALDHYISKTGDWSLLKELFLELSEIIQWHIQGTDFGIGVDPDDGLLRGGVPGAQLTWMDAKVDDWVVTPRYGKPVEVNALWYYALTMMETWAVHLSTDAALYGQLRSQVRQNFAARFWNEEGGYLYDVVDVNGVSQQNDATLRPNQLFAASLVHDLLSEQQVASLFQKVTAELLTPVGLRTLSPHDPNYHPHFAGDRYQRDSAYHQGTVWPWLMGAYVDVHLRVHNNPAAVVPLLEPLIRQLWSSCLGTLSEVAEPEPPYTPAGCIAQAWSVAELLRSWDLIRESLH
ncbi:glycogen debranching protein [Ktedonobacteria bacterium brp13]|nr:glycogen debranching protein [Ktedonobacteria bacterium brp13]